MSEKLIFIFLLMTSGAFCLGDICDKLKEYNFFPAQENVKPFAGNFGKLPNGARNFEVELPVDNGKIVYAADFGLNENVENAATIINNALAYCKKIGASKLVLPKGIYKCFDGVSISINEFKDFTFEGKGTLLIYHSESVKAKKPQWDDSQSNSNIKISNCERVKICNVDFDWDWTRDPLGSYAKLVNRNYDKENPYVDLRFFQYEKHPKYSQKLSVITIIAYTQDLILASCGTRFYMVEPTIGMGEGTKGIRNEWLSPNTVRLFFDKKELSFGSDKNIKKILDSFSKNNVYRVAHYYYGKDCISMDSNRHLTLENINIFSCRGHALHVGGNQKYWQYLNVNVPSPTDVRRPITCSADHHHIANSMGFMKLIGCSFSYGSDDGGNFHDRSFIMKKVGTRTLESANIRGLKFFNVKVGDNIILRNDDYSETNFSANIVLVDGDSVTLDKDLPTPKGDNFVCFNSRFDTRNLIIKDCKFSNLIARGLLLLAKDVTIENCYFENVRGGALKLETGYTFRLWCEGTGVDNVIVRNCVFKKSNVRGVKSQGFLRDILLSGYMGTDPSEKQPSKPVITNVLFENNEFYDTRGLVAIISASENIVFRNNIVKNDLKFDIPQSDENVEKSYRGSFFVRDSRNVKIVNNKFVKSNLTPNLGIFSKKDSCENCEFSGNKIIDTNE